MYTKNIVLEEVSSQDFELMKTFWGRHRLRLQEDYVPARIREPFIWPLVSEDKVDDYKNLFNALLEHPELSQIAINNHGRWEKTGRRKLYAKNIDRMAAIAANDQYKRYFLEAKFSTQEGFLETVDKAVIEFAELCFGPHDYRLVGFQTTVPFIYEEWFTVMNTRKDYHLTQGLWMPSEERLQDIGQRTQ